MRKLIECVPNFSEGRDRQVIDQITQAMASVEGVSLLDVDPGASTHRTVVTLVGDPEAIIEAAFLGIAKAAELIDMRTHAGAHPRMGATDVCPLIPLQNVSDEEAVAYARRLAERVGRELDIPVFLYEKAATKPDRKNLATIRSGEYEGFFQKIKDPNWAPDFGPADFNPKSGGTVIGVRDFLIAYNVNLNTTSTRKANSVAFDIREQGRIKTADGTPSGKPLLGPDGLPERIPGTCLGVKAIGWWVQEYGIAQVSMNITDMRATPLHKAFEECLDSAHRRGMRVTGSEIVGLLPKQCLLDAGKYFLNKQERSLGVSEKELIDLAIRSLGLNDVAPFDPRKKIVEYAIEDAQSSALVSLSVSQFTDILASESPAPGGGSVAALCGALGAALGAMVANLSAGKRGWEPRWKEFSDWAQQGQKLKEKLLFLVDEDTRAFNKVMDAFALPKDTEAEKSARKAAIDLANQGAAQIPFEVMHTAFSAYGLLREMAQNGNPNSITDAGVGALCLHTCIVGAGMNVLINLGGVGNPEFKERLQTEANRMMAESETIQSELVALVRAKLK